MKFEIKHRYTSAILFTAETESLKLAVELGVKSGANLWGADLWGANLRGADLRGANLGGANLRSADLRGAKGISKYITTPLYVLLDQVGKIRAYKLTNADDEGPFYGGIKYVVGKSVSVKADTGEQQCSYGISLASLDWCISNWKEGYKIKVCEFARKDIACIPIASDGKFRVSKCKVISEKDLKELGLE